MNTRGLTMMELLVAMVVLAVGSFVVIQTFSQNLRHSSQSRQRMLAALVMENLVEEVLAHPYGAPRPSRWNEGAVNLTFIVEGRPQVTRFFCSVEANPDRGNGSFFGRSNQGTDLLDLSVGWSESSGPGSSAQERNLTLDLVVRREL